MKTQPLKGMRDLLPREQALRDYIQGQILATYRAAGFQRISTPILEDMENLDKSDGGDNLNLIFKVLKRGPARSRSSRQTASTAPSARRRAVCASSSSATSTFWATLPPTPRSS